MVNTYSFCFNYYVVNESENKINYFEVVGKDENLLLLPITKMIRSKILF